MKNTTNETVVLNYLKALERGAVGAELAAFLHPEVTFRELPNRLVPKGNVHRLADMLSAAERGQKAVSDQRYEVKSIFSDGDEVALEVEWSAKLRVPLGSTPAGGLLKATLGTFITLRDGKVYAQRNYDCYDVF